jgi:ketosteroid isomerase-like protein
MAGYARFVGYADLVRKGYEAWNNGDRQWVLDHMDPDVEWVSPPDDPDPGVHRGYQGVERFWGQWRAAVGQLFFEPIEIVEAGEQVAVVARRSGTGEHSGAEIADTVVQVFTFRDSDRKCVRVQEYYDREAALAAIRAPAVRESGR